MLVINKETKTNASFKDLNKISKKHMETISSHLKESGSSVLLPNIDGIHAKNLLFKGLDQKDDIYLWLSMYQSVAHKLEIILDQKYINNARISDAKWKR